MDFNYNTHQFSVGNRLNFCFIPIIKRGLPASGIFSSSFNKDCCLQNFLNTFLVTLQSVKEADNLSMANSTSTSSCFHLPDPSFDRVSERFLVNLVTAIINIISSPFAVILNLLISIAIFNNTLLRTPSNLLIGCLALSDILVGLTVQPGYVTYRLMENQHRTVPCFVRVMYSNAFYICCGVSFMTLAAVSYERFVAVRLYVRYNNVFSSKRAVKYILAIWMFNVSVTSLQWLGINHVSRATHLLVWFLSLLLSGAANVGVVLVWRRHRRQFQSHIGHITNFQWRQRQKKLTKTVSFIVGFYLLFNIPVLFVTIYHQILKQDIKTYNHYSWAETIAFLNSCTNPSICLWKNRQIRQKILLYFRKQTSSSTKRDGVTLRASKETVPQGRRQLSAVVNTSSL